ncbi:hypothetical protein [Cupriavidus pinatubonensis]|uniref:hypothetical protein n=1 Tax=Cupriavidus pinatubonensis TaxID=248026 RepID=UPI00112BA82F|nr:hypothetical protein [Cupriavidus pinatubonensis]TPQ30620.1 hypothetical protein C2U69_30610 [Cupriavidus pinatubonensis]
MANPDTNGSIPGPEDEREDEAARRQAAGLRPIARLGSDERLARIQPETDSRAVITYCSTYVRDFVARDYNYCAAKFTLARGGKLKALDLAFREAEEAFAKALSWLESRPSLDIHLLTDKQSVELKHPLSGRLVRLLNQHDRIFSLSLCAMTAGGISPQDRDNATEHASRRISLIHAACMPDNDQFAPDGTRISAINR